MRIRRVSFVVVLLSLVVPSVFSIIFDTDKQDSSWVYYRVGMFSPRDAPMKSPPGDGQSYVEFSLTSSGTNVYAVLFHSSESKNVFLGGNHKLLCENRRLVLHPNNNTIVEWRLPSSGHQDVTESGVYYFLVVSCDVTDTKVTGSVTFMEPYGHVPGGYAPMLPWTAIVAAIWAFVVLLWSSRMAKFKNDLLPAQKGLSVVALTTCVEAAVFSVYWHVFNNDGHSDNYFWFFSLACTLLRKTASRVLVLVVSMGGGIVHARLTRKQRLNTTLFGIVYLLSVIVLEISQHLERTGRLRPSTASLLSIPSLIVDCVFYISVAVALTYTTRLLHIRRQTVKERMYLKFTWVLVGYVLFSLIGLLLIFFMIRGDLRDKDGYWQSQWILEAYWPMLFSVVFGFMLYLFRPTENNTRYAFSSQLPFDDVMADEGDDPTRDELLEPIVIHDRDEENSSPDNADESEFTQEEIRRNPMLAFSLGEEEAQQEEEEAHETLVTEEENE